MLLFFNGLFFKTRELKSAKGFNFYAFSTLALKMSKNGVISGALIASVFRVIKASYSLISCGFKVF